MVDTLIDEGKATFSSQTSSANGHSTTGDFMVEDRAKRATGVSHPIDVHVGNKIRQQRTLLGYSQGKLGAAVGLTFQQVQKYERGANRVGASRLYEISRVLGVSVAYFFDGLDKSAYDRVEATGFAGMAESQTPFEHDPFSQKETLDLVRAYYSIDDPSIRRKLYELAKSMSATLNMVPSEA